MNFTFVSSYIFIIMILASSVIPNQTKKFITRKLPMLKFNPGGLIEHTWLAVLMRNISFLCSGAIISSTYAVTAAHCCLTDDVEINKANVTNLTLWVGVHNRLNFHPKYSVGYNIEYCNLHFINEGISADHLYGLALIKTKTKIVFNFAVAPICLPTKSCLIDISSCIDLNKFDVYSYGWGADRILKLEVPGLYPKSELVQYLKKDECKHEHFTVHSADYYECIQGLNNKLSCLGLSGTPIIAVEKEKKQVVLVGIITAGAVCSRSNNTYKAYIINIGAINFDELSYFEQKIIYKEKQQKICRHPISKQ